MPSAKRLCPVHVFWPAIAARVKCGQKLFHGFSAQNVNTTLKAVLTKLDIPHAESYTSLGYRRGAAQELKERGCQWPIDASVGEWRILAFMGYIDIANDVAKEMSELLIEVDALSDDEVRHWVTLPCEPAGLTVGIRAPLFVLSFTLGEGLSLLRLDVIKL